MSLKSPDFELQKYTKHMEFHFIGLCILLNYANLSVSKGWVK